MACCGLLMASCLILLIVVDFQIARCVRLILLFPTQTVRSVMTSRENAPTAIVNCVKWLPMPGQGFVVGTNQGNVIIYHSISTDKSALNLDTSDFQSAANRTLFVI